MRRDWERARAKTEAEGACRACGKTASELRLLHRRLETAHTIGRVNDERGNGTIVVNPDDTVPLCGPSTDTDTCHYFLHARELELLPCLHPHEQLAAVRAAGGIEAARLKLAPADYSERMQVARALQEMAA